MLSMHDFQPKINAEVQKLIDATPDYEGIDKADIMRVLMDPKPISSTPTHLALMIGAHARHTLHLCMLPLLLVLEVSSIGMLLISLLLLLMEVMLVLVHLQEKDHYHLVALMVN